MIKYGKGKIKEVGKIKKGSKKGEVSLEPLKKFCPKCGALLKDGKCEKCGYQEKK